MIFLKKWLVLGVFLIPIIANSVDSPVQRLIQIHISNREDILKLVQLGLDIWETHPDSVIAYITDEQKSQVTQLGYNTKTLFNTGDDYLNSIPHYKFGIKETSGQYHSFAEVTSELKQLNNLYPSISSTFSIGTSIEGRPLMMIKISDSPNIDNGTPKILFMGCHHAREWISVEVPFFLAQDLLENYTTDLLTQNLVNNAQIYIIPVVNPDGHVYSQLSVGSSWRLWRKNRRNNGGGIYGVDLNRNYSYQWGTIGASPNPSDETYRGTVPFSEPETQAIRDFSLANQIPASVSYHSYGELVLFPWGYTYTPAQDSVLLYSHASSMEDLINSTYGQSYIAEQSSILYPAAGDSDDYLYGNFTTLAYTIELRPVSFSGGGFILPENQIQPTWEENKPASYYLIQSVINEVTGIPNWIEYSLHY